MPPAKIQSKITRAVAKRESKLPVKVRIELAASQAASGSGIAVTVAASRTAWLITEVTRERRREDNMEWGVATSIREPSQGLDCA